MIKKNAIANYIGQIYLAILGIAIVPFYVERLGAEGYGLVGFFALLQGGMQLLDMGISTMLAREASRSRFDLVEAFRFKRLQQLILILFALIACIVAVLSFGAREWLATSWLKTSLPKETVIFALSCIIISVCIRWQSGPLRSTLMGLERQVQLNVVNIVMATFRFPGSVVVLILTQDSIEAFFQYQIVISCLEFFGLWIIVKKYIPSKEAIPLPDWEFLSSIKSTLKFSLGIAFTSAVWVLITQLDKLLLSSLLPLKEYGYFTMAVTAAGGISLLSGPLSQAVSPRLAALHAQNNKSEIVSVYRSASRVMAMIIAPVSILMGVFSREVVYIWTGSWVISDNVAPIMHWYAWGNGALALTGLSYYLQCAYGNIRLHVIGNVIFALTIIPAIYFSTKYFGAVGAAKVWCISNVIFMIVWSGVVHRCFMPNQHTRWIFNDLSPFFTTPIILCLIYFSYGYLLIIDLYSRFEIMMYLSIVGLASLMINVKIYFSINRRH
ncbi:oligosaccharide flippase family protein [Aeromonas salmonicida]|uniref:oligosaccharide flippase family protein n=1 Tax=Aeromonas salmonicida TaxID=645 RepID=UPI003D1FA2E2